MRWMALVSLAFLAGLTGCATTPHPSPAPTPAPAGAGKAAPASSSPAAGARDDADLIAQEAVSARVTVTLHLDRLAPHRFARSLVRIGGLSEALSGTGVDPLRDVQRAFLAAHSSYLGDVAIVLQHSADEGLVARSLADLRRSFGAARGAAGGALGRRLDRAARLFPDPSAYPFPAAYRILHKKYSLAATPALIAAPHPGLLVVMPPERVGAVFRMAEVAGLPPPLSDEAMVVRAWDPRSSLQGGPEWSRDVRYAEAVFAVDAAGGATLRFRALCASPAAARAQAHEMTEQLERAQTLPIGGLRLFDPLSFRAESDRVTLRARLFAPDVDWLVEMSMSRL